MQEDIFAWGSEREFRKEDEAENGVEVRRTSRELNVEGLWS